MTAWSHRFEDHVYIVINGACVAKDLAHFEKLRKQMGGDVHMKFETDVTLVCHPRPACAEGDVPSGCRTSRRWRT